jgi:N-acyl homoserine lactone hydrolase
MRKIHALIVSLALSSVVQGAAQPPVSLWRLDCGAIQEADLNMFSDIDAYVGQSRRLTVSCYLIKHGDTYMLWDTGLPDEDLGLPLEGPRSKGESVTRLLPDELAAIGAKPLEHWLNGGGKLEEVEGDKDVFKDKSIVMLSLPGHTPGHHGLLVRLAGKGAVLLSGDVAHFRENYENNGVPKFNVDRAQSLASIDRFKGLAKSLHATVVIQHESADIAKLPAFPAFAQ